MSEDIVMKRSEPLHFQHYFVLREVYFFYFKQTLEFQSIMLQMISYSSQLCIADETLEMLERINADRQII